MILRCACLLAVCNALLVQPLQQPPRVAPRTAPRAGDARMMGRKFENNKLKMAKTALAYAKKASYIGKKVVVAVKAGGDDPSTNLQLAKVLSEANSMNVPKDVISRNIKKAMDPVTADYKELTYEAYGVGGVGMVINCLSDNNNRATADVAMIVKKAGCNMASSGSVIFNFARKGRLALTKEIDEEELLELAIEAGVDGDVSVETPDPDGRNDAEEVKCVVITESGELGVVQSALQAADYDCTGELVHVPNTLIDVNEEDSEVNYAAIDKLEELDDVTNVEHNMA
mmetsp:Transcript_77171/g.231546  ORF Transcript_77171/g.231546 Transcript_77171/m.231546 type:complete len:285 (-) Transcript_77171:297-1151(-)